MPWRNYRARWALPTGPGAFFAHRAPPLILRHRHSLRRGRRRSQVPAPACARSDSFIMKTRNKILTGVAAFFAIGFAGLAITVSYDAPCPPAAPLAAGVK